MGTEGDGGVRRGVNPACHCQGELHATLSRINGTCRQPNIARTAVKGAAGDWLPRCTAGSVASTRPLSGFKTELPWSVATTRILDLGFCKNKEERNKVKMTGGRTSGWDALHLPTQGHDCPSAWKPLDLRQSKLEVTWAQSRHSHSRHAIS